MSSQALIVPIDTHQFEEWRKDFPNACVLNRPGKTSMIHRASCHHFNFNDEVEFAVKWISADLDALTAFAISKDWKVDHCSHCMTDQASG